MSNLRKIGVGSLFLTGSRAIVNALGFISTIVLARLLVPEDFGLVAIAYTLQAIITAVTSTPVSQALIQNRDPTLNHIDTAFTINFLRSMVVAFIFAALSWPTAIIFEDMRLTNIMLALAVSLLLSGVGNPMRALLQKSLIFKQEFAIEVAGKVFAVITSLAIAVIFKSYWALIAGTVAGQLATLFVSYAIIKYRPRFDLSEFRAIWSFSGWMTLSEAVNTINWRSDQLFIGKFLSPADLGIYTVGDNLAQLPTREATLPLTSALFPAFSNLSSDRQRLSHAYSRAQGLVTAVALPVGIGFALISSRIIPLAMGEKWMSSVIVIQMLSAIFALQTIGSLAHPLALALGETKVLFRRDMQLFCIRLPIILGGLFLGGLIGVLIARVVTGLVALAFNVVIVRSLIGQSIREQLFRSWRSATSVLIMSFVLVCMSSFLPEAVGLTAQAMQLALIVLFGGVLYIGTSLILWIMSGRPPGSEELGVELTQKLVAKISKRVR